MLQRVSTFFPSLSFGVVRLIVKHVQFKMKIEKNATKKRKLLNEDISKVSKKFMKTKLKTKNLEHTKKEKCGLAESNKKVKIIGRLRNTEFADTTAAVGKEKKKISKNEEKNEKKKIIGKTNKKGKEDTQVSNKTSGEEKEENVRIKNNIEKANSKRKSLSGRKVSKKLKSDPDTSTNQPQPSDVKSIPKKKVLKRKVESEEKEDGIDLKDLSKKHILQCISAIFHLTQEQLKNKNNLFLEETQPIFMQVTCIRVPKVPRRQVRMVLPHSIVLPQDDVALFVCDLARGRRKDYEPTVDYYQELLDKSGCTRIKDIIPMNQVKTEYDQYELKRKLLASYDHFLVDGRIAGHMMHLLGKIFYKKRKFPTSIKMDSKDLKSEIDKALRKTTMQLHSSGDTHIIQVGNTSMKKKHILENVFALCSNLAKVYPGGWSNIRAIRLKTTNSKGLLIYMTLKNKNTVQTPLVKPKRPKAYRNVEGELTTLSGDASVVVTPEGNVIVKQTSPEESEVSEDDQNVEKE